MLTIARNTAILLVITSGLSVKQLAAQDESVLLDIHKRLTAPGYAARHDHERMIFASEIVELGPLFQGVCKQAVSQTVDFRVTEVLLGDPPHPTVHAGYVNCTGAPLPSPPFGLHSNVIVYCFHNMGSLRCLTPVTLNKDHLSRVKSWIAQLRKTAIAPKRVG